MALAAAAESVEGCLVRVQEGSLASSVQTILETLTAHKLAWHQDILPEFVGIHQSNRDSVDGDRKDRASVAKPGIAIIFSSTVSHDHPSHEVCECL